MKYITVMSILLISCGNIALISATDLRYLNTLFCNDDSDEIGGFDSDSDSDSDDSDELLDDTLDSNIANDNNKENEDEECEDLDQYRIDNRTDEEKESLINNEEEKKAVSTWNYFLGLWDTVQTLIHGQN